MEKWDFCHWEKTEDSSSWFFISLEYTVMQSSKMWSTEKEEVNLRHVDEMQVPC